MHKEQATAYDFENADLRGRPLPLSQFRGQPLLIVNTASHCFFARQFPGLEQVYQDYKARGLVVIGVPSNDFGHQEPHNNAEIAIRCAMKIGISFPMFAKSTVKGGDAHPLFKWLGAEGGALAKPRHNFYKYVIGRDGHLQNWFSSFTGPSSSRLRHALDQATA